MNKQIYETKTISRSARKSSQGLWSTDFEMLLCICKYLHSASLWIEKKKKKKDQNISFSNAAKGV